MPIVRPNSMAYLALVVAAVSVFACTKKKAHEPASSQAQSMTDLYGLKQVPTFDIELSPADMRALREAPKEAQRQLRI
ncbi:MAG: hypothetical protein GY811_12455 [Myxococcales bacterium]|nr:hypothetical protein [Myxococcales bacterium]